MFIRVTFSCVLVSVLSRDLFKVLSKTSLNLHIFNYLVCVNPSNGKQTHYNNKQRLPGSFYLRVISGGLQNVYSLRIFHYISKLLRISCLTFYECPKLSLPFTDPYKLAFHNTHNDCTIQVKTAYHNSPFSLF